MSKVLLVDDDTFLLKMYQKKFENSGFEVAVAIDGDQALEKVALDQPDIILLDLMMPKLDGYAVLKRLKGDEKYKNIPIIVTSNLSQSTDVEDCLNQGAAAYLVKSDNRPGMIVDKVKQILNI